MIPGVDIRSCMVVISWWSNCLGLACLERLARYAPQRALYYVQVGKSKESQEWFRRLAPPQAREIFYPADAPAEHSRVLQAIALDELQNEYGLWFADHDLLIRVDMEGWLETADDMFSHFPICLCMPSNKGRSTITQPLFWISPRRWPPDAPGFDPVPFRARREARQPSLYRNHSEVRIPEKDTLALAHEYLASKGRVGYFPAGAGQDAGLSVEALRLPPLPTYTHLGGLSLLAGPVLPDSAQDWMRLTVKYLRHFFDACPAEWKQVEDPILLERLQELEGVLGDLA